MLLKDGFTLFEVLVSLIILSISTSILLSLSATSNTNDIKNYKDLVDMQNQYVKNSTITNKENIVFTIP